MQLTLTAWCLQGERQVVKRYPAGFCSEQRILEPNEPVVRLAELRAVIQEMIADENDIEVSSGYSGAGVAALAKLRALLTDAL